MGRKRNSDRERDLELADLPPEMRWREWKARVEAVLFATPEPATREVLARVVGRDCALDLLIDDLKQDLLRTRPYELVRGLWCKLWKLNRAVARGLPRITRRARHSKFPARFCS
jgi:hypothetical protein